MSVKKLKRDSTFELISIYDDAVDQEKSDLKGYKKTLNASLLVIKEGEKPTLFLTRVISQLKRAEFDDDHIKVTLPDDIEELRRDKAPIRPKVTVENNAQLVVKYFAECVVGTKEWDGQKYVEDRKCDFDDFPSRVVQDLGDQAMILSQLGEPQKNA